MTIESIIDELDKLIANCEQSKQNLNDIIANKKYYIVTKEAVDVPIEFEQLFQKKFLDLLA